MISFLSSPGGVRGCRRYLGKRGKSIAQQIRPVSYYEFAGLTSLPAGASIFAAVDRLPAVHRDAAIEVWEQLSAAGQRLLNHPVRSLRRFELLRTLYESGRNSFQVYRGDQPEQVKRFPVFVRQADRHTGNLTPLLDGRAALDQAITWLTAQGYHAAKLLIVEFCDVRDSAGLIRKYSAFRVGDAILPKHLLIGDSWMLKDHTRLTDDLLDEAKVEEAQEYIRTNPHERWILEMFELARIEYGRIDYSMLGGVPQVWEINTDPTIGPVPNPYKTGRDRFKAERKVGQDIFHRRFREALQGLDGTPDQVRDIPVHLADTLRRALRAEQRRNRVKGMVAVAAKRFARLTPVRRLASFLEPAARPLAALVSRIPSGRPE